MNESQKLLLKLTENYLHSEKTNTELTDSRFDALYNEAVRQNLVQLLSADVCASQKQKETLLNAVVHIMMHYESQETFRKQVYASFEECGIDYIPLKGSIIKDLYCEPWHRTCGDIDILIRNCDIDRAVEVLECRIDCKQVDKSEHDIVIKSSENVVLELHYDLHEKEINTDSVWETSYKADGYAHMYMMQNEIFFLCHIAHMAKHFRCSGCGLRPFVDLYLMRKKMSFDNDVLMRLLDECGLSVFYTSVVNLIEAWFDSKALPEEIYDVADYVLTGGVFGSIENKVAISRSKDSGIKYFWKRAFVSREGLAYKYPVLKKHPYLYLICNTHRWYRLLFKGKYKKVKKELQTNASLDKEGVERTQRVLSGLGL